MRNNLETYRIWAPDDALWTQWAKPVLFARQPSITNHGLSLPDIEWLDYADSRTMIIVDLPGSKGVYEALALARLGYRPVPLYNGVGAQYSKTIVNVNDIITALFVGADELTKHTLRTDAPPVFMLDSNRMAGGGKQPGAYDNRWCVFPQDMPSAAYLIKAGINRVIVRSETIQNDLAHILCRYQKESLSIYHSLGKETKLISGVKPSNFMSLAYRFKVIFGLTRNATGGFGGWVPDPTQTTYRGYHRYG
jgi:hypothetical protein